MSERFFERPGRGVADDFQAPDLRPLRAAAEREELAEARARLAEGLGHPLPSGDTHAPPARDVAQALTEAGFTLHDCAPQHPRYRLGGVCLLRRTAARDHADHRPASCRGPIRQPPDA